MSISKEEFKEREIEVYREISRQLGSMSEPLTRLYHYILSAIKDGTFTKEYAQMIFECDLKKLLTNLQRIDRFLNSKE